MITFATHLSPVDHPTLQNFMEGIAATSILHHFLSAVRVFPHAVVSKETTPSPVISRYSF
ncbi:hypothetical protein SCLCIDRAFT_1017223 [Scleroderma citrinum Foug A]|uniref:Uncharacterized protein n=1 Tax=Scleroderma citrinum Foug A TaxID=1036808 RepID=A0A0C3E682_9AGAM|nr:hypothetical protein SCLCIDRAFT_1017223 [Scleroderma citrinum Foug A]